MSDLTWSHGEGRPNSSNSLFWWMRTRRFSVTTCTCARALITSSLSHHTRSSRLQSTQTHLLTGQAARKEVNIWGVHTIRPCGWNPPLTVDKLEFFSPHSSLSSICVSVIVGYTTSLLSETAQNLLREGKSLSYMCTLPYIYQHTVAVWWLFRLLWLLTGSNCHLNISFYYY